MQLPLTIISGYLGSGKTTLVNHLLRNADGRRLMVLVNDFGELPIDADLIQSRDGNTINLANGCACCSMGGDLFNALVDVLDQNPRPDHLLIEASGVADPARIANIALAEPDLSLDATISVVDAETFTKLIDDPLIGETIAHQIHSSDIILLNKLDLVDDDMSNHLKILIGKRAPDAKLLVTQYSHVPIELIIGIELGETEGSVRAILADNHSAAYTKWSKKFDNELNKDMLVSALSNLDGNVLRLKGIVSLSEIEEMHVVQLVGSRFTISPADNCQSSKSGLVAIGLKEKMDNRVLDLLFECFD